jgi:hypothetical protein
MGGDVARIGKMRNAYKFFLSENLKGRKHSVDLGVQKGKCKVAPLLFEPNITP